MAGGGYPCLMVMALMATGDLRWSQADHLHWQRLPEEQPARRYEQTDINAGTEETTRLHAAQRTQTAADLQMDPPGGLPPGEVKDPASGFVGGPQKIVPGAVSRVGLRNTDPPVPQF
ncbi:Hypothetical predicted protein [Pelobates cultripes]|uniref:Uncharacterized protein n=1 Tax=Pelobates cultripes TaxID=61616 RepID=A0AAD1T007_PELCU|nr:Hypothetical predicted protein [Pelobates cultripes]